MLSHHNNHLTALCGLAAASDVEEEREREFFLGGGGGGALMRLDSDNSRTVQCSTDGSPATPHRFALSVRHRLRAHSV